MKYYSKFLIIYLVFLTIFGYISTKGLYSYSDFQLLLFFYLAWFIYVNLEKIYEKYKNNILGNILYYIGVPDDFFQPRFILILSFYILAALFEYLINFYN